MRYRRVPIRCVLEKPSELFRYDKILNQYWAIDTYVTVKYVFFIESKHTRRRGYREYPVCGATQQTADFFINRLNLPLKSFYKNGAFHWPMIYLSIAWILKPEILISEAVNQGQHN